MRRFKVYRPTPPESYRESGTANAPDQVQFEGCVFSDGTVAVRWLTAYRSHSLWDSWASLKAVHGHMEEYGTIIEWLDEREKFPSPKSFIDVPLADMMHGSCNKPDCKYCNLSFSLPSPYTTGDD